MPRKTRRLDRDLGVVRDASLLVIASEDKHAVESYFRRFRAKRIQFVVLPTEDGKSSPPDVMARLDEFKQSEATQEGDQFWVSLDTDHWVKADHIQNLRIVLQQCRQKGYFVAMSHPCFELWLLLHFAEYQPAATDVSGAVTCGHVIEQLRIAAGGYTKKHPERLPILESQVLTAINRARALDMSTDDIPATPATRVYRILDALLARDSISLETPSP